MHMWTGFTALFLPLSLTFEIHLSIAIRIKYIYDTLDERILLQLRQGHELLNWQWPRIVKVKLAEPLAQPPDFIGVDCWVGVHVAGEERAW